MGDNNLKQVRFILILLIILSSKMLSPIDIDSYNKSLYILEGNIGERKATMYLNVENESGKLYGKYYYNDEKKFMQLVDGNINDRLILLREIDRLENYEAKESVTPIFRGSINNKKMIFKGVRFNATTDEKDKFTFELSPNYPVNIIRTHLDKREKNNLFILYESLILMQSKEINSEQIYYINKINNQLNNKNYFNILYKNFQEYKSEYKKKFNEEYRNAWSYEKTYEVTYIDKKIISLLEFNYSTTGAAHGTYSFLPSIFNLETGDIIDNDVTNFIRDINNKNLLLLMRTKLSEKSRYFDYNKIRLNNSFYFTSDRVYFIYNIYEIASYATGTTILEFTYPELMPFVKPSSDFWYLFE